jgi:hypothetical protein
MKSLYMISLSFLMALSCLFASNVFGLSMTSYTLPELWSEANRVGVGRVSEMSSSWRGTRIITTFRLLLTQEASKGPQTDQFTFQLFGGEIDGIKQFLPGSPEIFIHDELFVFLRCQRGEDERETYSPVGLGQGIWRSASPSEEGGETKIWAPLTDQVSWSKGSMPLSPMTLQQLNRPQLRSLKP